jgi:hypothetical protein
VASTGGIAAHRGPNRSMCDGSAIQAGRDLERSTPTWRGGRSITNEFWCRDLISFAYEKIDRQRT